MNGARTLATGSAAPHTTVCTGGLTDHEALVRQAQGLGNTPGPPPTRTYRRIITENVLTFVNVCLFGLGLTLVLLGRLGDAVVATGVISLNVVISVAQEVRAKRALDRIALLTRPTATVIRDGRERVVRPEQVVEGDLLKVAPGDQVVVDGCVVGDGRVAMDESLLTGEADPVRKRTGDVLYSGTYCASGAACYVAERVGARSVANEIIAGAQTYRHVLTPLQREIHLVIRIVLVIVIYFEFLLVITSLVQRTDLAESVENSTILAGLVPNGLFLSIAVAYALGAVRILRFGALVRQSNAVESLSHVDVLCLDKTGTLTANQLRVASVHPIGLTAEELGRILGAMAVSGASGNKTTEALAAAWPGPRHPVLAEVPFSATRKWSALAIDDGDETSERGLRGVYALGALEMLRPYVAAADGLASAGWPAVAALAHDLAAQGLRVLLVAHSPDPVGLEDQGDQSRLPERMRPLGLVGLHDVLRPEAREALRAFTRAGVRPKIISGDDPDTVAALARQAGLGPDIASVSGLDLDRMSDTEFAAAAEVATVFGRVSPRQKERLVRALRQRGHYVAMVGDGVNDVLSLKQADVGVAMQTGSQAARGVADLVLMRDSFAVLAPAVLEGQRIFNGMQAILRLFLARISTVGLVILSALVVGTFPLELRQGSLVTLVSVGVPSVLLAVWARPGPVPRDGLARRLIHFILPPALLTSAIALILFVGIYDFRVWQAGTGSIPGRELDDPIALATAQTTLTGFLAFCGLFLVIFVVPPTRWWAGGSGLTGDWRPTWLAFGLMVLLAVTLLVPAFRHLFALSPVGGWELAILTGALLLWLVLVRWAWRARLLERFLGIRDP